MTYQDWLAVAGDAAARLAADKTLADNMITWQLPHGGFYKNDKSVYAAPWNGTATRSGWYGTSMVELGTIDNNATVTETMFLADVYRRSTEAKYRDAARKALDFLLTMQLPSGGFPQVYPARDRHHLLELRHVQRRRDGAGAGDAGPRGGEEATARRRCLHGRAAGQDHHRHRQGDRLHPQVADRAGRGQDGVVCPARPHQLRAQGRALIRAALEERQGIDRRDRVPDVPAPDAGGQGRRASRHRLVQERRREGRGHRLRQPAVEQHRRQLQPDPATGGQHHVVPVLRPRTGRRVLQRPSRRAKIRPARESNTTS